MGDTPIEDKIVFALSPGTGNDPVRVTLGIPRGAWRYMRDGKTHHFDLSSAGLPIQLVLFGATDHADALKQIETAAAQNGVIVDDRRREDFGIDLKSRSGDDG